MTGLFNSLSRPRRLWRGLSPLGRYGIVAVAMVISMLFVDLPLSLFFRWAEGPVVELGRAVTDLLKAEWWLIPSGLLLLFFGYRRAFGGHKPTARLDGWIAAAAGFWFVAIAGSGILTNILKVIIGRARPKIYQQEGFFGFDPFSFGSAWNSLPSGHANTGMVLAFLFGLFLPRYQTAAWIIFGWLVFQRVVVNAHYLSDVLAGGAVAAFTTYWLAKAFARRGWVFQQSATGRLKLAAPGRFLRRKLRLS